jgi:excisionase family DNA binding protein
MDTIFKTLSKRERTIYANLKARLEQSEQSAALPVTLDPEAKPAPRRAHRVQHRQRSRDGEAAPDPEALAYCVKDAARLVGVSRATLYVLISTGNLRTVKIRKRRLIPREALSELLAGGVA